MEDVCCGLLGIETYQAMLMLPHVWEGRTPLSLLVPVIRFCWFGISLEWLEPAVTDLTCCCVVAFFYEENDQARGVLTSNFAPLQTELTAEWLVISTVCPAWCWTQRLSWL